MAPPPAAPTEPPAPPLDAAPTAPVDEPAPAAAEAAPAEAAPAEAAPEEPTPVSFLVFADANWGWQTQKFGTPTQWHRAYEWQTPGFTAHNGFALSFLGVDVTWDTGTVAATGSLRFGPSVPIFYAGDTGPLGIDNILQAYLTWRPVEGLSLDFGQFGTIFGAEVAESWRNINYSRGGLYYGFQPFWHTGLRAKYAFTDAVAVTGMLVNGVNNVVDDNNSPSAALQVSVTANENFSFALGGMLAFDPTGDAPDPSGFDRFVDLVATFTAGDFKAILNADYNQNVEGLGEDENSSFYGGSLALGYAITPMFGIGVRGEYLVDANNVLYGFGAADPDGIPGNEDDVAAPDDDVSVVTGTLTFDLKPIPDSSNLIIRWDNRIESGNKDIYYDGDGEATGTWFGTMVGIVVTSGS